MRKIPPEVSAAASALSARRMKRLNAKQRKKIAETAGKARWQDATDEQKSAAMSARSRGISPKAASARAKKAAATRAKNKAAKVAS